jgi:hypothetical protein
MRCQQAHELLETASRPDQRLCFGVLCNELNFLIRNPQQAPAGDRRAANVSSGVSQEV